MRNPGVHLVGITTSPGGDDVFGKRAEEELRIWLDSRLDALGIDPVAYSRFVLSLLRRPDSALSPLLQDIENGRGVGGGRRRNRLRPRTRTQSDREHKRAVVQCLTNAADQKCGVESLVDELCSKLRDLEGGDKDKIQQDCCEKIDQNLIKTNDIEILTPRDKALRYYAAFPALQPAATPKKTIIHKKDTISGATNKIINNNSNNNNKNNNISNIHNNSSKNKNNNNNNYKYRIIGNNNKTTNSKKHKNHFNSNFNNNNNSNRSCQKKSKMSIQAINSDEIESKETFGFAKSVERERDKESELELDRLRLAELQAKFDESLEALWDSGPGNNNDKTSIWAAPSFSIPSKPRWPIYTNQLPLILPINNTNYLSTVNNASSPYLESTIDDSPIIPWDIDLISIGKYTDECNIEKLDYNLNWSDYVDDGSWNWNDFGNNLINININNNNNTKADGCFYSINNNSKKTPSINSNDNDDNLNINHDNNNNNKISKSNNNISIDDKKESNSNAKVDNNEDSSSNDEDLLTSDRTHFRPIKEDHLPDGTTFSVNSHYEQVDYHRSKSGNIFYLPNNENPYMEYRENNREINNTKQLSWTSTNFTLKFRVHQCDKSIQTDPIRSPVKRRILSQSDHFYYTAAKTEDILIQQTDEIDKESSLTIIQSKWIQPRLSLFNDRKRRHSSSSSSSSNHCRPLTL